MNAMQLGYGWEKLYDAVRALASAQPSQQERIYSAWRYLSPLRPEEHIPEAIRAKFIDLRVALGPLRVEGATVSAGAISLDEAGAKDAVETIISLYDHVCRGMGRIGR